MICKLLPTRILVLSIILLQPGCSAPETRPPLPQNFERPIVWSGVRLTSGEDPHAYGLKVELWKQNGEIAGFLSEYVGPPADAPAGKLESVKLDEITGSFSFVSKLSVGVVLSEDGKSWVPAKNEYAFSGKVNEHTLAGSLQRKAIKPDGNVITEEEEITLERDRTADTNGPAYVYTDWLDSWNRILQSRGPRW